MGDPTQPLSFIVVVLLVAIGLFLYVFPTIVALRFRHQRLPLIAATNTLLGWTIIGWVVALVMSFSASSTIGGYRRQRALQRGGSPSATGR